MTPGRVLINGRPADGELAGLSRLASRFSFGEVEWLTASEIGDEYRRLLPTGANKLESEELMLLEAVFGKGGELEATKAANQLRSIKHGLGWLPN